MLHWTNSNRTIKEIYPQYEAYNTLPCISNPLDQYLIEPPLAEYTAGICLCQLCTSGSWYFGPFFLREKGLSDWMITIGKQQFSSLPHIFNSGFCLVHSSTISFLVLNHASVALAVFRVFVLMGSEPFCQSQVSCRLEQIVLHFTPSVLPPTLTNFSVRANEWNFPNMMLLLPCFTVWKMFSWSGVVCLFFFFVTNPLICTSQNLALNLFW